MIQPPPRADNSYPIYKEVPTVVVVGGDDFNHKKKGGRILNSTENTTPISKAKVQEEEEYDMLSEYEE